jgi:mannose-6-phosphate isomerase-like protein (cupin superfamily)
LAEVERTREREREPPFKSSYEMSIAADKAFAERQLTGRVLVRMEDAALNLTRQGLLRTYLSVHSVTDTPLRHWSVFSHEVRTKSGKHRHQGGVIIYVIDGRGYSVVNGERLDWKKGDLVLLPMHPQGVEHQHFNSDPEKPALWIAFIYNPIRDYVASEMTQTEVSQEYAEQESRASR